MFSKLLNFFQASNFVVVETGDVLEGRGWDYVGAHTMGYNRSSIGIGKEKLTPSLFIAIMGTFIEKNPDDRAIDAMRFLIEEGVNLGKISEDYRILPRCDLQDAKIGLRFSDSPGEMLAKTIRFWNDSLHDTEIIPENAEQ